MKGTAMPITTNKSKSLKIAYYFDKDALEKLLVILNDTKEEIEISITCSEGSNIKFDNKEQLLQFSNAKSRKIDSIIFKTPWKSEIGIVIKISNNNYSSVNYEISGNDKDVFYLSSKLDDYFDSLRLWYTKIAFADFVTTFFVFFIALYFLIQFYVIFCFNASQTKTVSTDTKQTLYYKSIIELSPIFILAFGTFVNKIRSFLFPYSNFGIGDGIFRYNLSKNCRTFIGVSFAFTLVMGILTNWVYAYLF